MTKRTKKTFIITFISLFICIIFTSIIALTASKNYFTSQSKHEIKFKLKPNKIEAKSIVGWDYFNLEEYFDKSTNFKIREYDSSTNKIVKVSFYQRIGNLNRPILLVDNIYDKYTGVLKKNIGYNRDGSIKFIRHTNNQPANKTNQN